MKYETLQQYAARHNRSYQRARMVAPRLALRGLGRRIPTGEIGGGSWVVRADAPWVGDGMPKQAKKGKKLKHL
jgi:hypothetical protein